jgi:excisionase family DNA binding protein
MQRKTFDTGRADRPPAGVDALLSPEEVGRRCGLSRRAVYRAIERGELRASRLCSRIRIRAADVDAWVDENEIDPPSEPTPRARPAPVRSADGLRRLLAES